MRRITKEEAARILGMSERAVERYSRAGDGGAARLSVTYERVSGSARELPMYDEEEVRALFDELSRSQLGGAVDSLQANEKGGEV